MYNEEMPDFQEILPDVSLNYNDFYLLTLNGRQDLDDLGF
jgi:hypothetical protein